MSLELLQNLDGFPNEHNITRALSRLLVMVERLYVFTNFMDENDLSHAHDETGIAPSILNALLIKGKQGKLISFNVALTLSGKFAEQFSQ